MRRQRALRSSETELLRLVDLARHTIIAYYPIFFFRLLLVQNIHPLQVRSTPIYYYGAFLHIVPRGGLPPRIFPSHHGASNSIGFPFSSLFSFEFRAAWKLSPGLNQTNLCASVLPHVHIALLHVHIARPFIAAPNIKKTPTFVSP